jgi:guanylate kinase
VPASHRSNQGYKGCSIVVISGPSGAGKSTLTQSLVCCDSRLKRVVAFTTRAKRLGEAKGRDYNFVNQEEFENLGRGEGFIDVANVGTDLYGMTWSSITSITGSGEVPLLVVDPAGGLRISHRLPSLLVFLQCAKQEARRRLELRGDDPEKIKDRLSRYEDDMRIGSMYENRIETLSPDVTAAECLTLIIRTFELARSK